MRYTYLYINLFSILIPFLSSFHKKYNFFKSWFAFWPAAIITGAIFIAWDVLYTSWGVWGFNSDYLLGRNILNLPLEEWLFFICIPYASVFTYAALKFLLKKDILKSVEKPITWILVSSLLILGLMHTQLLYTSVTFLSTALFLLIHLLFIKPGYMGRFYLAYLIIFCGPFFIVNGILTGSFLENPVVWYDNSENLGVRVFTIPVEDFIYGFLLILMNITIYEWLLSKSKAKLSEEKLPDYKN
jgi:lycopene cyclase domain-containing protein